MAYFTCTLLLLSGCLLAFAWPQTQEPAAPRITVEPAQAPAPPARPESARAERETSGLTMFQQQMALSLRRAGEWLSRANRADGRFVHGYVAALKTPLEGDHYLRQVGAAYALARIARFLNDERYTAVARQAVLTLLLDTAVDAVDPHVRSTTLPSIIVNRLGAAGLLIMAINELPAPGDDLLEQSEQLCNFIRKQQGADGSLSYADPEATAEVDPDGVNYYPGEALCGLMCSQRYRPAAWKTEVVRQALPYYRAWWRVEKTRSPSLVPWQTAAYSQAYRLSKDPVFAEAVYEMNDWLCDLQYAQLDPRHPLWLGGFLAWADGRPRQLAPQIESAQYAEALMAAFQVTQQAGDAKRSQRYRETVERCLQFLSTLQYTDANTQHFADWYRTVLLGAFHASHQDGNVRIDYTQHAACALVGYLESCPQ
jgi:hypothetical protein